MARVNIDILGLSELKWTRMDEFNSDDHYIYYCGQESIWKKWSSLHSQQKSPKCSTWVQSQKWQNDLCFQGKPFNVTVIQIYAPTTNAKEAEVEWFYEDLLSWALKNWCFWIVMLENWCFWVVMLEKTLETPLDCKEVQLVHPKGNQSWVFIRRTDIEAETPILHLM